MATKPAVLHVQVSGRVQGVFFRETTRRRAIELGLSGWVRNLSDGTVEAVFCGERAACEEALRFVRKGPPRAAVTGVEHQWIDESEQMKGFEIRF